MSNMMSMTMKQPVRPAPALQRETQKSFLMSRILSDLFMNIDVYFRFKGLQRYACIPIPAVDHNWPSRGWIGDFNSADKRK